MYFLKKHTHTTWDILSSNAHCSLVLFRIPVLKANGQVLNRTKSSPATRFYNFFFYITSFGTWKKSQRVTTTLVTELPCSLSAETG